MDRWIVPIALTAYLLAALFTYGWTYHRTCDGVRSTLTDIDRRDVCGIVLGAVWPLYWSGKIARDALRVDGLAE